jgi:superfamily II DNA or RNA helicase
LILATGSYIGEGFDDARLDTLFLAMPISWKGTLHQYVGRLHRLHDGKKVVEVYDYVDADVLMLACMYGRRLKGYADMGYKLPVGCPAPTRPLNSVLSNARTL